MTTTLPSRRRHPRLWGGQPRAAAGCAALDGDSDGSKLVPVAAGATERPLDEDQRDLGRQYRHGNCDRRRPPSAQRQQVDQVQALGDLPEVDQHGVSQDRLRVQRRQHEHGRHRRQQHVLGLGVVSNRAAPPRERRRRPPTPPNAAPARLGRAPGGTRRQAHPNGEAFRRDRDRRGPDGRRRLPRTPRWPRRRRLSGPIVESKPGGPAARPDRTAPQDGRFQE